MKPILAVCIVLLPALAGCAPSDSRPLSHAGPRPAASPAPAPAYPGQETRVLSQIDAQHLIENKGLTLQWIDWNHRGSVAVKADTALWTLRGAQAEASGPGRLFLDGTIAEIGKGYFTFDGTIRITDTPDRGRSCEQNKTWHFAITQNRSYYRLREFEWCDGLTDYIDIYF